MTLTKSTGKRNATSKRALKTILNDNTNAENNIKTASNFKPLNALLEILIPHWVTYQQQYPEQQGNGSQHQTRGQQVVLANAVVLIQREIDSFLDDDSNESSEKNNILASCLKHFFNCAIASVCERLNGTNDVSNSMPTLKSAANAKESVDCIIQLTAAVSTVSNLSLCDVMIRHAAPFASVVSSENVRASACQFIGYIVQTILLQNDCKNARYNEILDYASQTIIPRFTDKSQIVRMAAIVSGQYFFIDNATDPDILQAMQWSLQHDPSVVNRQVACQVIPLNLETIDYVLPRIRDVKAKVRCIALQRLQDSWNELLDPSQAALAIVSGWTNRCSATKEATRRLICAGLMKKFQCNPVELLRYLNVIENESACEIAIVALHETVTSTGTINEVLKDDLNGGEIESLLECLAISVKRISFASKTENDEEFISAEELFLSNTVLKCSQDQTYKDELLSSLVPDISVLCSLLERHASALVHNIHEKDEDKVVLLMFVCLQLLKLACHQQSVSMEEGSRRIFIVAMRSMLANILTPDDLIEGCIETLRLFEQNGSQTCRFVECISVIIEEVREKGQQDQDLQANCTFRILSILLVALEHISSAEALSRNEIIATFILHVMPYVDGTITENSALFQEAAVGCLGKLGLLCDPAVVQNEFNQKLMDLATTDKDMNISVKVQALLALSDFSMLINDRANDMVFCALVSKFMDHPNTSVQNIAFEVATKLLFAGKVDENTNSHWLARLVLWFFDQSPERNEESSFSVIGVDAVVERGSSIRLYQLLSTFFPALCVKSQYGQDALMGAISPLLHIVNNCDGTVAADDANARNSSRKSSRKSKRIRTSPVARIIEFISYNVHLGELAMTSSAVNDSSKVQVEPEVPESSPALIASIQVAEFLSENLDNVDTAMLRMLCKLLGGVSLDVDKEACEHIQMLKDSTEEIMMLLEDETCIRSLQKLEKQLESIDIVDVEDEDENEENIIITDEEEEQKLQRALKLSLDSFNKSNSNNENDQTLSMITPTNSNKGK